MAERKSLSKKIRFEVFKRDSFTCQYCGRSAPDVILHVDHIQPVSKDGDNNITNLITSCADCNGGKSNRELSDDAVVQKRKKQLDELQERREQLDMMVDWQKGLVDLSEQETDAGLDFINSLIIGYSINEYGRADIKKMVAKYGLAEVLESAKLSADEYLVVDENGSHKSESVEKYFAYIEKIVRSRERMKKKPYLKDLYYIRGIIRHRFNYSVDYEAISLLERAYLRGHDVDELKAIALDHHNWSMWRNTMEALGNEQ